LYIPCPASGCGNTTKTYWVHSKDDYYIWISNKARIKCTKSYCSTSHMRNWKFKCSNHSFHNGEYHYTSATTWIEAVTALARHVGDDDLILDLLIYLRNPSNRW
jgi:hypothetical protein